MTPEVMIFFFIVCAVIVVIFIIAYYRHKTKEAENTRHVITLPIGTRFALSDSDSTWVLIHLEGCGQAVEWRGIDCSTRVQRHRQIVNKDADLKHVVAKVVS